ncbi:MAG: dUTP diphosphatase [Magnetococcus sp. WYHC-3]
MSDVATVEYRVLPHGAGLPEPMRQTDLAAGFDLAAALDQAVTLQPGERRLIPTGLQLAIPPGYEGQVRPRSGLALKHGVTVLNAPGTIDADYRGEVGVVLVNLGQEAVTLQRGDRVAQLVVAPVAAVMLERRQELATSGRGAGGFGHTGR